MLSSSRITLTTVLVPLAFFATSRGDAYAADCPVRAPIKQVAATGFYVGKGSFQIDPEAMRKSNEQTRPIQMYLIEISRNLDDAPSPGSDAISCAVAMLRRWADADALLLQPDNFEGVRQRQRFVLGFNLLALKVKSMTGRLDGETIDWLRRLTRAVISDYSAGPRRGNLYSWSGVVAASFLLLADEEAARRYADSVWSDALGLIKPNGTVDTEIARGTKSTLYHMYYLSSILMHRAVRESLGYRTNPASEDKIRALASVVVDGFCTDQNSSKPVTTKQDIPPAYQFAIPLTFDNAYFGKAAVQCLVGLAPGSRHIDSGFGGDMSVARHAIEAAGQPR